MSATASAALSSLSKPLKMSSVATNSSPLLISHATRPYRRNKQCREVGGDDLELVTIDGLP